MESFPGDKVAGTSSQPLTSSDECQEKLELPTCLHSLTMLEKLILGFHNQRVCQISCTNSDI